MRRSFLTVAIIVAVSTSVLLTGITLEVEATSQRKSSIGDYVLIVDDEGRPRPIDRLETAVDEVNRSIAITGQDSDSTPFWLYVRKGWLESIVPEPAFANRSFSMRSHNGTEWFGVRILTPSEVNVVGVRDFRPEVDRAGYTFGSPRSILLERPMFVSLSEVPGVRWERHLRENRNGTWWETVPLGVTGLGINLTDANTSGQVVTLSRDWLGTFGLANPYFQYADGTPIENSSDESHFFLRPRHFSILYVFTTDESFWKEDDGVYSNVFWDPTSRNIYVLSDRRDPVGTDERMRSPSPVTYDETTSFTVRAAWKTTQQGHWQKAVPLFFMDYSNMQVHSANSLYILYTSRASGTQSPRYYLRYVDGGGVLRLDYSIDAPANVQLEFSIGYDAGTRAVTLGIYDSTGVALGTASLTLGANEGFTLGKVGAGAWGGSDSYESATITSVDNIFVDANVVRNGGFEVDTNTDGIPDRWQVWPGSQGSGARSSTQVRFGVYSFRIDDSSSALSYGLQAERLYISTPSESYAASAWIFVQSGHFDLYLEFFNSFPGGTRIGVAFKSTTAVGEWEFLDLTMMAPTGTASVDVLVYSSLQNTGTAYFDGTELRRRQSFWSINNHDGDAGPGLAGWVTTLDRAADLGVSYLRTDLRWEWFESNYDEDWNSAKISYWRSVIGLAKSRGIDIIPILHGRPWWIEPTAPDIFLQFGDFCTKIAEEFGTSIYYYQILNEPNWNQEVTGKKEDTSTLTAYCYSGLLAGENVNQYTHKSAFKTVVNVLADYTGWDSPFLRQWLDAVGYAIDLPAIDHYPATNPGAGNCDNWAPLDALFAVMRDYSKEGAIMETGYSSYIWPGHTEQDQANWVNCALPIIRDMVKSHNANYPTIPLLIASWYELVDQNTGGGPDLLLHYGLLRSDLTEKPAYTTLRTRVPEFDF